MLKISLIDGPRECRLVLEGKLITPWAAELWTACEKARTHLDGREFVVDMKQITSISREGEEVLLQLMKQGVKFRCRDVFTRLVFKQLSRRAGQKLQEAR